jgi:hypothetical protein
MGFPARPAAAPNRERKKKPRHQGDRAGGEDERFTRVEGVFPSAKILGE